MACVTSILTCEEGWVAAGLVLAGTAGWVSARPIRTSGVGQAGGFCLRLKNVSGTFPSGSFQLNLGICFLCT